MNGLESDLKRLPEPALPEGLSAAITARIEALAGVEEEHTAAAGERPVVAAHAGRDVFAWALALAGVTVGLGAHAYRLVVGEATLDITSLRIGPGIDGGLNGLVEMLPTTPGVAILATGLLLCLAGLLAPLGGTDPGR